MPIKILAFAGSLREGSYNKKLVKIAIYGAESAGAEVTYIDLKDYPLPLYDGDIEEKDGLPENAKKLKDLFLASDGFLIASPEYNSGMSGVLKNVMDWVSRQETPGEQPLKCFRGKYACIMSTSPGGLGGLRGLFQLRNVLQNIKVTVMPDMYALGSCKSMFAEHGGIIFEEKHIHVEVMGEEFVELLKKFKSN